MAPTDEKNPIPENGFLRDAWRCDNCGELMYNTKPGHPHPVAGAPMPHFISSQYPRVCTVCWDVHNNARFNLDYWQKIQREYRAAEQKRKSDNDGLTGRKDYFTGM